MDLSKWLAPRSVWRDGALLGGALAAANLLASRADPGWMELNPTPWVLLPVLLGGRYGFGAGLGAGLMAMVILAGVRVGLGQAGDVRGVLTASPYFWASLPVSGAVAGELWDYFRRQVERLEWQERQTRATLRQLDGEVVKLRGAKDELDRMTAAQDGQLSSLDADLRRLQACAPGALAGEILQVLKRQARVADAAIYRPAEGAAGKTTQRWRREVLMGNDAVLPIEIDAEEEVIVGRALRSGSLVTLPAIMAEARTQESTPLMAAPLAGGDGRVRAMLVVGGMPFIAFTPAAANVVSLACSWSGGLLELSEGAEGRYRVVAGREGARVFFEPHFRYLTGVAHEACLRHRLPSALVEIAWPGRALKEQGKFERAVLGAVRGGDFVMQPERAFPALVVLLPLAGERGTDIFVERCVRHLGHEGIGETELRVRRVDLGSADDAEAALAMLAEGEEEGRGA